MRTIFLAASVAALAAAVPAAADHHGQQASAPDYALGQNWLCRPGQRDACSVPLDVTDIAADGTVTQRSFAIAEEPAFDCFYVYPTVSNDPTPNSDMVDNDEERRVAMLQAAPFQQACRMFAPLYRQVTLTALRQAMATGTFNADWAMAYGDVKRAWDHYIANDNGGRGVLLIGHSQGTRVLNSLIAQEIDGKPVADRMIAAYLIGSAVAVPPGEDVGGDFQAIPLCREPGQTGCVVSFASFRYTVPPPANSRFGVAETEGMVAACTNPANLSGGSEELDAWLSNATLTSSADAPPWTADGAEVATSYVRVPGLLSGECVEENGFNYLKVTVHGDPADSRTDDIAGDVIVAGQRLDDWGLHLIDMNLAMGDMVALAEEQASAWIAEHSE